MGRLMWIRLWWGVVKCVGMGIGGFGRGMCWVGG